MIRGRFLLFLIFLLGWLASPAQRSFFRTYSIVDGLVDNRVRFLYQDRQGFIWISTWEGLSRYNGHRFVNFSTANGLSHDLVNEVMETDKGLVVMLNDGSVDRIWQDRPARIEKFRNALNTFLKFPDGRILATSDAMGIFEFSGDRFIRSRLSDTTLNYNRMVLVQDSLLLAYNEGTAVLQVLSSGIQVQSTLEILREYVYVWQLFRDREGRVWVCTERGLRLVQYDPQVRRILLQRPPPGLFPPGLADLAAYALHQDGYGDYWLGCEAGLVHISPGSHHRIYTAREGLPDGAVTTLMTDREGNLWVGTRAGLAKMPGRGSIRPVEVPGFIELGMVSSVSSVKEGKLMVSTFKGPMLYNPSIGSAAPVFPDYDGKPLTQRTRTDGWFFPDKSGGIPIYQENSEPWTFINGNGYFRYEPSGRRIRPLLEQRLVQITNITTSSGGGMGFAGLWDKVGVQKGDKVWIRQPIPYRITSLAYDPQGYLWAGTWENGLFRIRCEWEGDSLRMTVRDFSALVPDRAIRSLFIDRQGRIWVGTRYKGAFCLRVRGPDSYEATGYGKSEGLSSQFVISFSETSAGDIWVGSLHGLDKLVKTSVGFRVFNFSRVHNFFGAVTQMLPAGGDDWWCVNEYRLFRITDTKMEQQPAPVPLITEIKAGNEPSQPPGALADTSITLRYAQNRIRIEFSAPSFFNENGVLYSYRLLGGSDSSWTTPRNLHEVAYASLEPGDYRFQVRVLGLDNRFGPVTELHFHVRAPFWKTPWFAALCLLGVAAFFYGLYRYRINQLRRVQAVRNRIATDLHDDIGSTLTNISILSELSLKNLEQPAQAAGYLGRISEEINSSGQALDDIIWNINSRNDTLEEVIVRMRRYAAELFDHTSTCCQLSLPSAVSQVKIGMEQRRDLYLMFKESLNNIYKHARAANVSIRLNAEGKKLSLEIEDDGVGFDTGKDTHRNGLKNMKTRMEKWGGSVRVQSRPGEGTFLRFEMPLR